MLKDRVIIDENGFKLREGADPERKAYYVTFTLADGEIDKSQGREIKYWDAMNPYSQRVQPNSYVYIWETKDEIMVDECRIYLGNGRAKPRISWSIEKEQAYGDYAYMIRLKWIDHQSDRIHSSHIWLKNSQNGRKYSFLTEYIAPENGREEDCYIIEILPGRANPTLEGDRLYGNVFVTAGTIGKVTDLGITDVNNMGAAMAPAAVDTLTAHLSDTGRGVMDYDLIVTGDLGRFGSEMFRELCLQNGIDVGNRHLDCGNLIFSGEQKVDCGGSGCGCCASVLNAYLLERIEKGDLRRIFFMATGALLSPTSSMQNDSIPGIAHGIVLERK